MPSVIIEIGIRATRPVAEKDDGAGMAKHPAVGGEHRCDSRESRATRCPSDNP